VLSAPAAREHSFVNTPAAALSSAHVSPADSLAGLLTHDLSAVETLIAQRMMSPVGMIPDVAGWLVDAGGKRLRPMITLAAARVCGGGGAAAHKLAAAVEFIHSATLLHDDVVDRSDLRRGRRAANLVWGDKASVLVGDFLFARSFNLMVEAGDIRVLDVLARASSIIAEGEVMQLAAANEGDASRERYMAVIDAKTAALFSAAAKVGAMAAGADASLERAMGVYGRSLGLAFQLADDALDYGGLTDDMGKNPGDDFREGKATLPLILARDAATGETHAFWDSVLAKTHQPEDFARARALVLETGAVQATLDLARAHAEEARSALDIAPPSPYRSALQALADYCVDRVR
jgi:octaprenyl-diphosphate synthase